PQQTVSAGNRLHPGAAFQFFRPRNRARSRPTPAFDRLAREFLPARHGRPYREVPDPGRLHRILRLPTVFRRPIRRQPIRRQSLRVGPGFLKTSEQVRLRLLSEGCAWTESGGEWLGGMGKHVWLFLYFSLYK